MGPTSMNDEQRWTAFVEKLCEDTLARRVAWEHTSEGNRENVQGPVFTAKIPGGGQVAVYQYWYRYYTDADEYEIRSANAVELVDERGKTLWRLPTTPAHGRLFDAVTYVDSDAEDILNRYLG